MREEGVWEFVIYFGLVCVKKILEKLLGCRKDGISTVGVGEEGLLGSCDDPTTS